MHSWFRIGADALQRIGPEGMPRVYACPICRRCYGREQIRALSREDAPMAAMGGNKIALTCRNPCNNDFGSKVEKHVKMREADLAAQRAGRIPARMGIGRYSVQISYGTEDNGVTRLEVDPDRNTHDRQAAFQDAFHQLARDGHTISLQFAFANDQLARVAWLKSAYMVGFAAFGYSYVWSGRLDLVRRQIRRPTESLISTFVVRNEEASESDRRLVVLGGPEPFQALLVQMGKWFVFLPWLHDLYPKLEEHSKAHGGIARVKASLSREFLWPNGPRHSMDFDKVPGIRGAQLKNHLHYAPSLDGEDGWQARTPIQHES